MTEAIMLAWKLSPAVLLLIILWLLVRQYELRQELAQRHETIDGLMLRNYDMRQQVAAVRREAETLRQDCLDAQGAVDVLRNRAHQTGCPCEELKAAQQRIAHLQQRNDQLTLNALVDGVKIIKVHPN